MQRLAAYALGFACACAAQAEPVLATKWGMDGFVTADRLPEPEDVLLAEGYRIFGDTCQNCHGGNKATGAPNALNGFVGPKYTQMPARGANPDLTDAEVVAAVTYMISISGGAEMANTFIQTQKDKELGQ